MEVIKKKKRFKDWRCGGCDKLLGIIYPTKTIAIKHKDLTLWVDGNVKLVCRYCKSENNFNHKDTANLNIT